MAQFKRTKKIFTRGKNYTEKVVNAEEIKSTWSEVTRIAKDNLLPSKGPVREETFNNAMSRLKLSESDLPKAYLYQLTRLYIFTVGLAIGLGFIVYFLITQNFMAMIACMGFSLAMAALSFQASFRSFQIQRRELVSILFWSQHPRHWLPLTTTLPPPPHRGKQSQALKVQSSKTPRA